MGKSSLINKILGENRLIVSDIAGTTRDAIDTLITYDENSIALLIQRELRRKIRLKKIWNAIQLFEL